MATVLAFVKTRLTSLDERMEALKASDPSTDEWRAWARVTFSGLKEYFGADSEESAWFLPRHQATTIVGWGADPARVAARDREVQAQAIDRVRVALKTILDKYEALAPFSATDEAPTSTPAKAFLSHGGSKESLRSVEDFLRALGVEPIVVERGSSEGREVHGNVDYYRNNGDFAVVIWTKDIQGADGKWMPSGSVSMEAGELRVHFGSRIIFLAEEGVDLHTLGNTIAYQRFSENNLAPAFQKIVTELRSWGWLRVTPAV